MISCYIAIINEWLSHNNKINVMQGECEKVKRGCVYIAECFRYDGSLDVGAHVDLRI